MVKANKLAKGMRKGLPIYVIKLNKPDKETSKLEPEWLSEYQDVFPKELTDFPPKRDLIHEIELIPRT